MTNEKPKLDTSTMRPVVIGKGRGARRTWIIIGYAGKASKGEMPIALLDGTDAGKTSSRRGAWMGLAWMAGAKGGKDAGLIRKATPEEVERRVR